MYFDDFNGSCGAVCLNDFGGGEDGDDEDFCSDHLTTKVKQKLVKDLSVMKSQRYKKVVFAVTTGNQPAAEEMLEALGFTTQAEPGMTSDDRTIRGWVLHLVNFDTTKEYF